MTPVKKATKLTLIILLPVIGLALGGCKKEPPPPKEEPKVEAEPAEPEPPRPKRSRRKESLPETVVKDGIPTPEDYEEEAATTIAADNLEDELDKLEAEIGGG